MPISLKIRNRPVCNESDEEKGCLITDACIGCGSCGKKVNTMKEKAKCIIRDIREEKSTDPGRIFRSMAGRDYISIHGPEHHVLDGACILTAYANAGGDTDLEEGLQQLFEEGLKMPGAMCGLWGVCGAVASAGAAPSSRRAESQRSVPRL